ncbi:MAG: hypothetical protein UY31_C0026G0005 [Candidatus Wolfebacteria bacterium GW2011_GWE1_48_7]|uniref:Uncharacterized protein n=2 Tax=Candidatus Wolfeibacteriota TaxID=1752735 RepID=A0A0G1U6Z6_9BACT|nr:MAG: hypothetical protein UX70_C0001G0977 [Candidatus Wolfebacteria bacterium GW2011_GWB1_47_1]KKU35049.1 MAG: hypothetical protein UX49_C0030G0012 [Candidatus Wolfebacteria bacterium GW2011_GWC2_46_275]KKU41271.1 MAG: hypothetical protein UX58_C0009G0014 [Candidatus Wolfebacteria bacterium GW2011_GWB2_46_69]KKU53634.1 MAG: hypothetical protein UX76_C0012G0014 [Candidatus Wolfebacteria bacterium GW2011_GWC1_47_103]KKU59399.1 MAG: hypothetical protein UX83_C0005G0018 [Candidatus Wolfebacteria
MKNKQEIIQEFLDNAQESLIRIELTESYLQKKYAEEQHKHILDEMAKLAANKKETQDWISFMNDQSAK